MKNKLKRIGCLAAALMLAAAALPAAECFAADDADGGDADKITYLDFIDEEGMPIGEGCEDVWGTYNSSGTITSAAEFGNADHEEKAVKLDITRSDKNGALVFESGQTVDPIGKKDFENAAVKIRMFAQTNQKRNLPANVEVGITGENGESVIEQTMNGITLGEWCDVEVALEPNADELDEELTVDRIELKLPNRFSESGYSIYISKLQIVYEHKNYIETEISTDEDAIVISWDGNFDADLYRVYCNGEQIGETADKLFRYIPKNYGKNFAFTVEGYDGEGTLLATSTEKSIFLYDPNREVAFNIIGEDGTFGSEIKPVGSTGRTGIFDEGGGSVEYSNYDEIEKGSTPTGGNSQNYTVQASKGNSKSSFQLRIAFASTKDFSEWAKNGYFEFMLYPESEPADDFNWNIKFYGEDSNYSISDVKVGEWNYFRLPLKDFYNSEVLLKEGAARIQINFPKNITASTMKFKVANMCITVPRKATTASIVESGIDDTGRSYTDVSFSREMDRATVSAADFKIEGFNATGLDAQSGSEFRVYFDKAFEFPKEYTLEISTDTIRDADQRKIGESELSFKTRSFCPDVAVNSVNIDKTDMANGSVRCDASLTAIFKGSRAAVSGKVLVVASSNDRVIATAESAPFEAAVGGRVRLNAELVSDELKTAPDCQINLYFISDDENERPLCAYENK